MASGGGDAWAGRLRDVLGAPVRELTASHIEALVPRQVPEHDDLDFKGELYGTSDSKKRDLCDDVAALANHRGGVIILGVGDKEAIASRVDSVELSDSEDLRMKSIVADGVVPHLPFDVVRVPSDETPSEGYYLLVVPPSPSRPHAVRVENKLRYPRRDGTRTRWLPESEIADMYRDRFAQAQQQVDQLTEIVDQGLKRTTKSRCWVAIGIVPASRGYMRVNAAARRAMEEWTKEFERREPFDGFFNDGPTHVTVGVGSFTMRSFHDAAENWPTSFIAQLRADGLGYAAFAPFWDERQSQYPMVFGSQLLEKTTAALRVLGLHAVENTGSYGDVVAELRVVGSGIGLFRPGDGAPQPVGHGKRANGPMISRHTLDLGSLTGDVRDRLIAARILLTDIVQDFGVPEMPEIAEDGTIRFRHFGDSNRVVRWAEQSGVPVSEDYVDIG